VSVVASGGEGTVPATVEVVEPVGADNYLHLDIGDDFIARVDADVEPEPGDEVLVSIPSSAIHLFDADSGASLLAEGEKEPLTV